MPIIDELESGHHYFSTACMHDKCDQCRQQCKFCASRCECNCHATKPVRPDAADIVRRMTSKDDE